MSDSPERKLRLHERPIEFHVLLPSLAEMASNLQAWITATQRPAGTPAVVIRRKMSYLSALACAMALSLVVTSETSQTNKTFPFNQPFWLDAYAVVFGIAGILSVVYWRYGHRLPHSHEFYLRMMTYTLALIASLGWGALTVINIVIASGTWVKAAPWLFIILYFGTEVGTYYETINPDAVDDMRARLTPQASQD